MSQRKPNGQSYKRFSLQDYKGRPEVVKKANDAAMEYLETELGNIDRLRRENLRLKSENLLLKEHMRATRGSGTFKSFFTFLGGILITFGIVLVVSSPGSSIFSSGGLLIVIGIVVALFGFFSNMITRS